MTSMTRADRYPNTPRYLGTRELGGELGVSASAVAKWLDRYPPEADHPFPAPDVTVGDSLGWSPERLDEVRRWRAGMPGRGAGGGRPSLEKFTEQVLELVEDFERDKLADLIERDPEWAVDEAVNQVADRLGLEGEPEIVFDRGVEHVERIRAAVRTGKYDQVASAIDKAVADAPTWSRAEAVEGDQGA